MLLLYITVVAFASVPKQVFFPEQADWAPGTTCGEGLEALFGEIAGVATSAHPSLRSWDRRHAGLAEICAAEGPLGKRSHKRLLRLRYRVEGAAERHDREYTPLAERLRVDLQKLPKKRDP